MLNILIPHIDESITGFSQNMGLAEHVMESGEDAKKFPAIRVGNGEYNQVELEREVSYHRQNGEIRIDEVSDDQTQGCNKTLQLTYPLIFIGCIKYPKGCDQYATNTLSAGFAGQLASTQFKKDIRSQIMAISADLFISSINTDRNDVWNNEYEGIEMSAGFEYLYFAISYDIRVKILSTCFNQICT